MHKVLIAILIIITLVVLYRSTMEKMTKIYRGVGMYNTGNDPIQQVASGIVNSNIKADYANTYDEGGYVESCDLCPNSMVCPHCPQFKVTDVGSVAQTAVATQPSLPPVSAVRDIPAEHMQGECRSVQRMHPSLLGSKGSHIMHGPPRGMFHKRGGNFDESIPETDCRSYKTRADEILYHDIMGLDYPREPASDECEFFGINGYVYKEPCDMKYIMDEQAKIMSKRSSTNRN